MGRSMANITPIEPLAQDEQGSGNASANAEGWQECFLNYSVFAFSSPDLELMYQQYLTSTVNLWTWATSVGGMIVWMGFVRKFLASSQKQEFPPGGAFALLHPVTAAVLFGTMLFKLAFYTRHH